MEELLKRQNIHITNIVNPFDPLHNREFKEVPRGLNLKECIDLVRDPLSGCYYVAAVNGELVPEGTDYALIYPQGNLVLCAVPEGGGGNNGGKNILRIVLQVVVLIVAVVATIVAPYGAPAWWGGAAAAMGLTAAQGAMVFGAIAGLAVSMVGNLLIGALLPYDMGDANGASSQSATYSWDAPANPNREGVVWPVLYGTMRITPPIISKYIEMVDDKQYLNILFAIADHAIDSVDDSSMLINGNATVKDVGGVTWETRLGALNQAPCQYFGDTRTTKASGSKLTRYNDYVTTAVYAIGDKVSFDPSYGKIGTYGSYECIKANGPHPVNAKAPDDPEYWKVIDAEWITVDADGTQTEGLGIAVSLPRGLFHSTDAGAIGGYPVFLEIEYKESTMLTWTRLQRYNVQTRTIIADRWSAGYWIPAPKDPELDQRDWVECGAGSENPADHNEGDPATYADGWIPGPNIGDNVDRYIYEWHWVLQATTVKAPGTLLCDYIEILAAQTSALRRIYYCDHIAPGSYQVRARLKQPPSSSTKVSAEVYFDYVESIIYDDFSYPGSSLLALRALATDKLSGGMPNVSFIATRSTVPVWTGAAYENKPANNPAWASYDVLHNAHYGGCVPANRIKYADFAAWAQNCITHYQSAGVVSPTSFFCNLYVDASVSIRKILNTIGSLGRGNTVQMGSDFTCFVDKLETMPAQSFIFNMGNINSNSFALEYLPMTDRANAVDVTYWDKDDLYKQKTLEVHAIDFDSTLVEVKKTQITLPGCTSRAEALCHANFAMNCNRLLTATASWGADIDAIGCLPWDVIEAQHDMTLWGDGGRVVAAALTTIELDKEVTIDQGTTYALRIQDAATDEIKEYTIASVVVPCTYSIIGTFNPIPALHDKWTMTSTGSATKLFRMIKTSRTSDLTRKLICLEYNADIYDDSGTLEPPESPGPKIYVSNLKAEEIQKWNGSPDTDVSLSWTGFAPGWFISWRRSATSPWVAAGMTSVPYFRISGLDAGITYTFCVSHTRNPGDGVTVNLAYTGIIVPPTTPLNFTVFIVGNHIGMTWDEATDITTTGYKIYLEDVCIAGPLLDTRYDYTEELVFGIYNFTLIAVNKGGASVKAAAASITIKVPDTPVPVAVLVGEMAIVTWPSCKTTFAIAHYLVNEINNGNSLRFIERVKWTDEKEYSVVAVDVNGNESEAGTIILEIPHVPTCTAIVTTGLINAIRLDLTYDNSFPEFAVLEIWASRHNNHSMANKVGETAAKEWTHSGLELISIWYYWVRIRDKYDNLGIWYPPAMDSGVIGMTSVDPHDFLELLTDRITKSQLTADLLAPIELLDRVIPESILELVLAGDKTRTKDRISTLLGAAILGLDGTTQTDGFIYEERQVRVEAEAAVALIATTLSAVLLGTDGLGTTAGKIYDERVVRVSAESAIASSVSNLSATILGANGLATTAGKIYDERVARVSAEGAIASNVQSLSTTVGGHTTSIQANASAISTIDGNFRAVYTVKMNANGRVAGFGLSMAAGVPSEFIVVADSFALVNVSETTHTSGVLVIGQYYNLKTYVLNDNFSNVGGTNTVGEIFKATGTTPTCWANASVIAEVQVPFIVGNINGVSTVGINGNLIVDGSIIVRSLASGTITSKTIALAVTDGQGDAYIAAGKTDFATTNAGFILGIDDSDGNKAKLYIGNTTKYLVWDGSDLSIGGDIITTGNIKANNVTNVVVFYSTTDVAWSDVSWKESMTQSITTSGYPVFISVSIPAWGSGPGAASFRLYRGNTLIFSPGQFVVWQGYALTPINFQFVDTPAAGTHTYSIQFLPDSATITLDSQSVFFMEIKR